MANDLHFQLLDPSLQREGSNFRFGFVPPVVAVDGVQKLANRWLKKFCTERGSNPSDLTDGTEFPTLIGGNIGQDPDDLRQVILLAMQDTDDQLRAVDQRSTSLTADERLRQSNLLLFQVIGPLAIEFWVEVVSISGVPARMLIPYATG